jgi:hypothetical protein
MFVYFDSWAEEDNLTRGSDACGRYSWLPEAPSKMTRGSKAEIELFNSSSLQFCFCCSSSCDKTFQTMNGNSSSISSARPLNSLESSWKRALNEQVSTQEQFCPKSTCLDLMPLRRSMHKILPVMTCWRFTAYCPEWRAMRAQFISNASLNYSSEESDTRKNPGQLHQCDQRPLKDKWAVLGDRYYISKLVATRTSSQSPSNGKNRGQRDHSTVSKARNRWGSKISLLSFVWTDNLIQSCNDLDSPRWVSII